MAAMLQDLGPRNRREWELLEAVQAGKLSLGQLHDAWKVNELDQLKAELRDTNVEPHVDGWLRSIRDLVAPDTLAHYRKHVRSLFTPGKPFQASRLTVAVILDWLAALTVGPSTKRKYHAALSIFCEYLVARGLLPANPMRSVRPPPAAKPRRRYLDHPEVLRLVEATPPPYRTVSAVAHGTGMELGVVVELERGDIDTEKWTIHARGTKNIWRDRVVGIEDWAIPYLREHIRLLTPGARIFPGMNRWTASDVHRKVCKELGIPDYQLRDARHTYAVRMIRTGMPAEMVARQLGHVDPTMVTKNYGRFHPSHNEVASWHRRAAEQDLKRGIGG
ncbi:MAG: tyrosine-type recombinase/integrase [Gemmatimonadales bacterium]|nr:tyrosine-type recombinase/integrase [Gemmatimonadales bacterium]